MRDVSDPQVSPDGAWVAYTVSVADTAKDQDDTDIWMASWDGNAAGPAHPEPGGRSTPRAGALTAATLAFLSDRDDTREVDQLWLLDRAGRRARAGHRPARRRERPRLVARRPAARADRQRSRSRRQDPGRHLDPARPTPIVIDRFQFKEDETGWLGAQRDHLYLYDVATRATTPLVTGDYDEAAAVLVARRALDRVREPPPAGLRSHRTTTTSTWSRRRPAREPRQLTTFEGPDNEPGMGRPRARLEPGRDADRLRPGRTAQAALLRRPEGGRRAVRRRSGAHPHARARPQRPVAHLLPRRRVGALPARGRSGVPPRAGARGRRDRRADGRGRRAISGFRPRVGRPDRGGVEQRRRTQRAGRGRRARAPRRSPGRTTTWLRGGPPRLRGGDHGPEPGRHRDPRLHGQAARLSGRAGATPRSCGSTAARSGSTTTTSPTWTGRCSPRTATSCSA